MRLVPLVLAAVVLAGCTTVPVPPQRPDRVDAWPAWEVGDSWTWHVRSRGSDGTFAEAEVAGRVVSVGPDTYVVNTVDSQGGASNDTFWRANMTPVASRTESFRLPLAEGANWTSGNLRFVVKPLEYVSTPAGRFHAWRIDAADGATPPTLRRTEWWAPEAKIWVKSDLDRAVQGGYVSVERELQEYRLASGGP